MGDDKLQTFQHLMMSFDTPAYMRRARDMDAEWNGVVAQCRRQQEKWQQVTRIRVARFLENARDPADYFTVESVNALRKLHAEWATELRLQTGMPVRPERLAVDIQSAFERFNERWERWLPDVDLSTVNARRQAYNDYYVLEKECAVRSAEVARRF